MGTHLGEALFPRHHDETYRSLCWGPCASTSGWGCPLLLVRLLAADTCRDPSSRVCLPLMPCFSWHSKQPCPSPSQAPRAEPDLAPEHSPQTLQTVPGTCSGEISVWVTGRIYKKRWKRGIS